MLDLDFELFSRHLDNPTGAKISITDRVLRCCLSQTSDTLHTFGVSDGYLSDIWSHMNS